MLVTSRELPILLALWHHRGEGDPLVAGRTWPLDSARRTTVVGSNHCSPRTFPRTWCSGSGYGVPQLRHHDIAVAWDPQLDYTCHTILERSRPDHAGIVGAFAGLCMVSFRTALAPDNSRLCRYCIHFDRPTLSPSAWGFDARGRHAYSKDCEPEAYIAL